MLTVIGVGRFLKISPLEVERMPYEMILLVLEMMKHENRDAKKAERKAKLKNRKYGK